ncbi:MAG: mercuric transporter MerT family protein [Phycisphaerae bacterium]
MNMQHPTDNTGGESCCTPKDSPVGTQTDQNAPKTWSAGAVAVVAAILASACCWLPLALLGLGLSAAGLAKFIIGARWIFVAVAVVALGLGFYFSYGRRAACAPGEACAPGSLARFNRVMLWISAVLVVAFATFPYYSAPLQKIFGGRPGAAGSTKAAAAGGSSAPDRPTGANGSDTAATNLSMLRTYKFHISGMDCQECANGLQGSIAALRGVKSAKVSFAKGTAVVKADGEFKPEALIHRITGVGYKTTLISPAAGQ